MVVTQEQYLHMHKNIQIKGINYNIVNKLKKIEAMKCLSVRKSLDKFVYIPNTENNMTLYKTKLNR